MTTQHTYAPVDHPGADVPDGLRPWGTPWPGYAPVDITPPELRAAALEGETEVWITDPVADPTEVADWGCRRARAVLPYEISPAGAPLNPTGRTGRAGRNLGSWGENAAADPIVVAGVGEDRQVLLVRRGDVGAWAIPGGMLDPGETAQEAAVRELREETGVDLAGVRPQILSRGYVADWRATDHAWVCSTAALYLVPGTVAAVAGDDAVDARWWPAATFEGLAAAAAVRGGVYEAHLPLLEAALERAGGRP